MHDPEVSSTRAPCYARFAVERTDEEGGIRLEAIPQPREEGEVPRVLVRGARAA